MTDKVRVDVICAAALGTEINDESARIDRSRSWVLQKCLKAAYPALAAIAPGSPEASALQTGVLREPARMAASRAALDRGSELPEGTVMLILFMSKPEYEQFDGQCERLRLASEEVIAFAWRLYSDEIRKLPGVNG